MPLTVNCGLSRKASENYQSLGVSINVTAELDQSLLARPDELQAQIDDLYRQAHAALERRASAMGEPGSSSRSHDADRPSGRGTNGQYDRTGPNGGNGYRGYRNGNGGNGRGGGGPATDSQRRAINAIATRLGVDPHLEARDVAGADLADLTIRQASDLIDHLKSFEPAGGNGNGRNGSRR